jgi:hypothetical protein
MTVLLNKWDGQQFENNNRCHRCRGYAATAIDQISPAEIKDPTACGTNDHIKFGTCKNCLLDMVAEIDRAVLAATQNDRLRPIARREGN